MLTAGCQSPCKHEDGFALDSIELRRTCVWCGLLAPGEPEHHTDPTTIARVVLNRGYAAPRESEIMAKHLLNARAKEGK